LRDYVEALKPKQPKIHGAGLIMVIDDDLPAISFYVRALRKQGYDVRPFSDGAESVEFYETCYAEVSLVILDMIMPDMDGPAVFKRLKEINPDVRVILASGFAVDAEAEECLRQGALEFLVKPLLVDDLFRAVGAYVDY
jgi:two-component system cell cycle sensor histidine kinase/response regulator CckA